MKSTDKNIGNDYVCGHPIPGGGRCREPLTWPHPCPVHRTRTYEEHPLSSRKCGCERPLADLPEDSKETPTCVRCGHDLPDLVRLELRR